MKVQSFPVSNICRADLMYKGIPFEPNTKNYTYIFWKDNSIIAVKMCTEPFVSTKYVILRNSATFYTTDIIQNLLHTTKNAVVVAVQCIFLMFAI